MRYLCAALLLIACGITTAGQDDNPKGIAPEFALKAVNSRTIRLSDYRGKVVLLNVWATWCAPCRAETPDLMKWQKQYQSKGLQILAVTSPPYKQVEVRKFARNFKLSYPTLDATEEMPKSYGAADVLTF